MDDLKGYLDILLRLCLAMASGTVLGWERESRDKPAGLRTHMMVSLGSALFLIVGLQLSEAFDAGDDPVRYDPLRIVQGIIGGVGFLGAGAIIHSRGTVHGITTAASIWLTAAIGIACGAGLFQIALTGVVLGLVVLFLFGRLERKHFEDKTDG